MEGENKELFEIVQLVLPDNSFYVGELIVSFPEEGIIILENVVHFESIVGEKEFDLYNKNEVLIKKERKYIFRPYTDSIFPRIPFRKDFFITMFPASCMIRFIYFYIISNSEISKYKNCVVSEADLCTPDSNGLKNYGFYNIKTEISKLNKLFYEK